MKKLIFFFCFLLFTFYFSNAQSNVHVYPTNWWVGMKHNSIQLLIRSDNTELGKEKPNINYPGIKIVATHTFENAKYIAVDIVIGAEAKPGTVYINLTDGTKKDTVKWLLKERRKGNGTAFAQGVTSSDFIYLLMPDRFSNGDTSNDRIKGMKDQSLSRDSMYARHGGDMQGVINHLDYLQNLGVTTLWMTPVLENDMPNRTEHGYAFTDHYAIEPRFGGATAYKKLSDELHKRGMKLIQDAVYNHIGLYNFLYQDAPAKDWFHQWPVFTHPNYKDQTLFDPYGAASDRKVMTDGWFTTQMPDLDQTNPYVADFLIQHAIWCVEEFGVDGWRIDTYIYLDLNFMNKCNQALIDEYPHITMFGEAWVHGTVNEAYFTRNNINTAFKSNLTGVTDFQCLFYGIQPAMENSDGVNKLYQTLSNDILYQEPLNNVIFLDNHDMTRFFSQVKEDIAKDKMGIQWLLTERGIPEMYYGTEILMKGISNPDGLVRSDFPGGWEGDRKNAFTKESLSQDELDVQKLVTTLANFRKISSALKTGKMTQYVPQDGLYVYFRYDTKQTVMCIMNAGNKDIRIHFEDYAERIKGFTKATNVTTGEGYALSDKLIIPSKVMWVLDLK
jgi:neopullulanase